MAAGHAAYTAKKHHRIPLSVRIPRQTGLKKKTNDTVSDTGKTPIFIPRTAVRCTTSFARTHVFSTSEDRTSHSIVFAAAKKKTRMRLRADASIPSRLLTPPQLRTTDSWHNTLEQRIYVPRMCLHASSNRRGKFSLACSKSANHALQTFADHFHLSVHHTRSTDWCVPFHQQYLNIIL